jgi:hypothetical protein
MLVVKVLIGVSVLIQTQILSRNFSFSEYFCLELYSPSSEESRFLAEISSENFNLIKNIWYSGQKDDTIASQDQSQRTKTREKE